MNINWYAVLTGFAVALGLSAVITLVTPLAGSSILLLAAPALVGGFVAGYMVSGASNGAIHGGLATVIGAISVLVFVLVLEVLAAGLIATAVTATIGAVALAIQAIPGAAAGAFGGWLKIRREPEAVGTATARGRAPRRR